MNKEKGHLIYIYMKCMYGEVGRTKQVNREIHRYCVTFDNIIILSYVLSD